jgi:lipoprotein-anchoring transpeptidase ErfK/SrfK
MVDSGVSSRAQQRRHRRKRLWASIGVALLLVVAAGIGVVALSGGSDNSTAAPVASTTPATTAAPLLDTGANVSTDLGRLPFRAAATKGTDIAVFGAPDADAKPMTTLPKQTEYLLPRTLLAFDQYQDWLHVYLPTRPNSSTGWIKASDVNVSNPLEWQIRVSLADHHLWLFHNGVVEYDTGTAIGSAQYPTPTGTFYITDPVDLHKTPNLGYGVFALGLSGHSDVLTEFGGGDGQIAIHGTNNPGDIGQDVSHGCVRIENVAIERLSTLPLGTPVVIS